MRPSSPLSTFASMLACVAVAGCGSGDSSTNVAPSASYGLSVTPPAGPTTLGTQISFGVNLASNGFTGPVMLSATGVPASWQVAFSPSMTVNLASGGGGSATATITIPSNGAAAPSGIPITIHGSASAGSQSDVATVTVANQYVITIADGTGAGAHWGALTGTVVDLAAGATLVIRNDDSVLHQVHAGAPGLGLPHQGGDMAMGQSYTSSPLLAGQDVVYCHDHGTGSGQFTVRIQ